MTLKRLFCCGFNSPDYMVFERAPEPSDVYWENLYVSDFERFFRLVMTYFATFILLVICFVIIYLLNVASNNLNAETK